MPSRKLAAAILIFGVLGLARAAIAQDTPERDSRTTKPLGGLFQDLGTSVFGTPADKARQSQPASPRAGSTRTRTAAVAKDPPKSTTPQPSTNSDYSFTFEEKPGTKATEAAPAASPPSTSEPAAAANESATSSGPAPLHQRLQSFRQSPFADTAKSPSEGSTETPEPAEAKPSQPPISTEAELPANPENEAQPAPARSQAAAPVEEPKAQPQEEPANLPEPATPKMLTAAQPKEQAAPAPTREPAPASNVLMTRKSPILGVETTGPRRIVVGKEAAYELTLRNSGEVAADEVTVFVSLPAWAEVVGASASVGEAKSAPRDRREPFQWALGHIDANGREKLLLKIVPRESKPFDLGVRWDYMPASSQATIEVQEPKLALAIDGPREAFYGKREVYKLKLSNVGNGAAENVMLSISPLSTGQTQPISHRLGTLAAAEERTIEVELTARQAGNLTIKVEAHGDGSARAELAEKVMVRRAGLQVALDGPSVQYVGAVAAYKIHIRNPGDAAAKNVKLGVTLPNGVKYSSGTEGVRVAADGTKVQWNLDQLEAGGQRTLNLKCALSLSGSSRLDVVTMADDDLTASAETTTRVEAMADLRLEVKDPAGPIAVGDETTYELRVRNRGTKSADNVEIVTYFSEGVEPVVAEGHPNRLAPGQVIFHPITSMAPNTEVVLTIRARAAKDGNHIFRAEVHCKPLGTRLVREETTHFYLDGAATQQASRTPDRTTIAPDGDAPRTADRRSPAPTREPSEPSRYAPPAQQQPIRDYR